MGLEGPDKVVNKTNRNSENNCSWMKGSRMMENVQKDEAYDIKKNDNK